MVERETLLRTVTALQKGDQAAAAEIYDSFYDDTYYFLKSTVLDPELAADLAQDTFVEVLEKIHTLKEPAAFPSWIRRIAYHKAMYHFRKSKDVTVGEDEDGNSVFDTLEEDRAEFIPDQALDQEDFKATILSMLQSLPETQRSALVLHYYEERSVQEIAEIQGVSQGTVKSRLNYGRNAIKQSVESYEKKNGIKLHSVGVAPVLLWLFGQGVLVREGAVISGGFAGVTAASSVATAQTAAASVAVAKTAAGAITAKIIAAVAAVAVVVSGAAIAISNFGNGSSKDSNKPTASQQEDNGDTEFTSDSEEPSTPAETIDPEILLHNQIHWDEAFRAEHLPNVVGIYFVDTTVPEGVQTMDISELQNGNVVMWKEETHEYDDLELSDEPLYNMYITTTNGGPIVAPEICSHMFNTRFLQELDFSIFNTSLTISMAHMFAGNGNLQSLDLSNFDTSNVIYMCNMFYLCNSLQTLDLSNFDTSNVTHMHSMFSFCGSLQTLDLSNFDTSNVIEMQGMFFNCGSLQALDLSNFNTSNVTYMSDMFGDCSNLQTLDLSNFDTSNVIDMKGMFYGCKSLQTLDLSSFDTSNVTNMDSMFCFCSSLQTLDISNFDTSNVGSMGFMFKSCSSLQSLDLSHFDTSNVTSMIEMFSRCEALQHLDVSHFDTSNVRLRGITGIFYGCDNLETPDISGWVLPEGTTVDDLF